MKQQIVNGVTLGAIYALTAVAYSMVYGIVRLINFAFSEVFMLGAYVAAFCLGGKLFVFGETRVGPDLGLFGAAALAMLFCGLLGLVIERIAYRPLRHAPLIAPLLTTLGISIFLQGLAALVFGSRPVPFPSDNFLGGKAFVIGGAFINRTQVVILVALLLLSAGLIITLRRSMYGLKAVACAHDIRAAELQGINSNRVIASTFFLGSMMAGLAGMLWAALYSSVYPQMGFVPGLTGLVAAVLGGIGTVLGAVVGGLLLGIVTSLGVAYIPGASGFGDGFTFAVLILLLWLRPEGLLGSAGQSRPGAIERSLPVFTRGLRPG